MAEEWDSVNYELYTQNKTQESCLDEALERNNSRVVTRVRSQEQRSARGNYRGRGQTHSNYHDSGPRNYNAQSVNHDNSRDNPWKENDLSGSNSGRNQQSFRGRDSGRPFRGRGSDRPYRDRGSDQPYRGRGSDRPYRGRGSDRPYRGRSSDRPYRGRGNSNRGQWNSSSDSRRTEDSEMNSKGGGKKMGYHQLKDLLSKDADEIMLSLKAEGSGFKHLLQRMDLNQNNDLLVFTIQLLQRATECTQPRNLSGLMSIVADCKSFTFMSLTTFLMDFRLNKKHCKDSNIEAIVYLIQYLIAFSKDQPATSCPIVKVLVPQIKDALNYLLNEGYDVDYVVLELLEDLETSNERNMIKFTDQDHSKIAKNEKLQSEEPPNCFRYIPIYPTQDDLLNETPFLRPNIMEGKYLDVEHYLDVQFRLLREDSVSALREGITEFRNSEQEKNSARTSRGFTKVQGLKVYKGVNVLYPRCTVYGLAHVISFDMRRLQWVRWETSKRLLEGSLVCLSKDKFQTMIFATVTKRDLEQLKTGVLYVKFEVYDDIVKSIRPHDEFVMIETSAFFEAYRHVLVSLQGLYEHNLSFKRYIVELNEDIQPPKYLAEYSKFDLRPLMSDFPKIRVCEGGLDIMEVVHSPLHEYVKSVTILDQRSWPPAYEMNLDQSQQDALRTALTKEFAIIQGPPGTGKTYIGLKIVQTLLQNISVWGKDKSYASILIVCFTNHALDQFLEGVLYFTNSLVRVGARSQSEVLEPFKMASLRQDYKRRKAFPQGFMINKKENLRRLEDFEKKIHKFDLEINRACSDVLPEIDLKHVILKQHLKSLRNGDGSNPEFRELHNDQKLILDWLGLRFRGRQAQVWFSEQTKREDFMKEEECSTPSSQDALSERDRDVEASLEFAEESLPESLSYYKELYDDEDEESVVADEPEEENIDKLYLHEPDEYWELNGGAKARRNYLTKQLRQKNMMSKEQETKIDDIWALSLGKRWDLYRLWCARYITESYNEIADVQARYKQELADLEELRHACDLHILKSANVIGMTTTGAAKNKKLIQDLKPSILIVEEAAEVMEAHIVTCLTENTQHVIMIGDHQQLRPIPAVHILAEKYNLDVSLFERLVKNKLPFSQLSIQHRMHPFISKLLVPHIYKVLEDHNDPKKYLMVRGIEKRMFFVTHDFYESHENDSTSKVNVHEAKFLVRLSEYIIKQGYKPSQVTILATYSGQLVLIRKLMNSKEILKGVTATSVDNYQGEENDIVLVSFVRSNADKGIGFLKTENRVCVALSRARMGLYCVGNFRYIETKSPLWKNIVSYLDEVDAIGPNLQLYCQNHPHTLTAVGRDTDFDSAPEGGCTQPCDIRLPCGHKCSRLCHSYDRDHSEYRCQENCQKITCKKGHRCIKKCFQCSSGECGPCGFRVLKELSCGHETKLPCFQSASEAECRYPCEKSLACGHRCTGYCSQQCIVNCREMVSALSPCTHPVKVQCHKSVDSAFLLKSCLTPCRVRLSCDHDCTGTCSTCMQGRLHVKCKKKCGKTLVCGHECREPCSSNCPPCKQPCENRCKHSKCDKLCGVPCSTCREPCTWTCPHNKCTRLCGERCDRPLCREYCPKKLPCKHPCVGLCGEPCPKLCRICNKKKLTEIFFGSEEDEGARFIMLRDCLHIFEVFGFFEWLEKNLSEGAVQMPRCPKCQTTIRDYNTCTGDTIKASLINVNLVKEKCFGHEQKNARRQRDLKIIARDLYSDADYRLKPALQIVEQQLFAEKLGSNQLASMENILNVLRALDSSSQQIGKFHLEHHSFLVEKVPLGLKLDGLYKNILQFITNNVKNASIQQMEDVNREVQRFQLLAHLIKASHEADKRKPLGAQDNQRITACYFFLFSPKPLQSDADQRVQITVEYLNKSRGLAQLNITEREKIVIVKAMGLNKGHWFKCPNGHVYSIGECGGPTQMAKCPECKANIGGIDHRLQEGNSLADEMDGASYPAYSDASNLQNYDIREEHDWFDEEG